MILVNISDIHLRVRQHLKRRRIAEVDWTSLELQAD
jgi:hypothetical protein